MDNDAFVIEASIGGVRVALSTTNDESFSLKRSASEIDIDFTCFNGTLSIKCPSSSDPPKASSIIRQEEEKDFLIVEVRQESALPKGAEENNDATNGGESLERTHQNEGKNDMIAAQSERTNQQKEKKPPQRKLPERSPRFRGAIDESVLPRFREPNSDVRSTLPASARHDSPGRESLEMSILPAPMGSCSGLCARLKQSIDREDIIEETEADSVGPGVESSEVHLSELQLACALPRVPARELQAVLDANPQAASETDSEGRYPLHILSENEPLLSTFVRKKGALDFCLNLFEAYPEALIIRDHTGAFPFVHLIQNWVNDAYEYEDDTCSTKPRRQGLVRTLRSKGKLASLFSSDDDEEVHLTHESSFSRVKFPHVVLTRQAQVSFEVLSAFLDHLNESYRQGGFDRDANMLVRAVLAKSIAGIPNLLKTIFLIDDTDKRHWVSCCSIVERIFFCYESTGDWVANMIQRGSVPSRRAVDYLVELSGLTVADHVGPGRSPRSDDYEAYQRDRRKVFAALEASAPLIQSLTVLGNDERGRAATTDVVWQILNHCLSNPLVVGFLLADFVFSIVLLQTFRFVSNTENISLYGVHADATFFGREAKALFLSVSLYFLLRKLSEFYSLLKLSPRAFRSYLKDFWNFIDVAAIGLSLAVVLSQTDSPLFLALAMACLWMKLLGLLRAMNAHLATFILAIIEIVKDIRWFLLVLAIAIFMFADVIHIITVHADNGAYCTSGDAPEDFCQSSVAPVYLKLYAVMVGDVNLEDFSYSRGIDFLFVLFTLMGIIILLNILIAVVGDSYKRSVLNARYLFGRARVDFAVTFVAQEDLLKSGEMPETLGLFSFCSREHFEWFFKLFCRLVLVTSLFVTAGYSIFICVALATGEKDVTVTVWWSIMTVIFGVLLIVSVTLVAGNMLDKPLRQVATRLHLSGLVVVLDVLSRTAEVFARRTFGIGSPHSYKEATEMDPRIKLLQDSILRIVSSAKESLVRNVDAAEQRIKANASSIAEIFYAAMATKETT